MSQPQVQQQPQAQQPQAQQPKTSNPRTIVVTHDGIFHADEVFAVALLSMLYNINVVRTRSKAELTLAVASPIVWVVDVGGVYDPKTLCFDHHQDGSLPSAAGLVWQHVKGLVTPNVVEQEVMAAFFEAIDAVDCNRDGIHQTWGKTMPRGMRHTSQLISGFNRGTKEAESDEAFAAAVSFAVSILKNELHAAKQRTAEVDAYNERETLPNGVAVFQAYNAVWRDYADYLVAVMPTKDGWQVLSRDTNIFMIPATAAQAEGCVFHHANGFIAVFQEYEQAIQFARSLQLP